MKRIGSCSCGDVKFCVEGNPINTVFCYCKECQVSCGSDRFYGIWIQPEQITLTQGRPKEFTRKSEGSGEITFKFCGNCGTKVYGDTADGGVIVAGATLDNTDGIEPKMAFYTKSASKWAVLPTDIPCFETFPDFN